MKNYLSNYDAETLPTFSECVKFNGTKVLFTPIGIRRYRERFARAGFDIATIVDAEDLQRAIEGSYLVEAECLAEVLAERRTQQPGDALEWALRDALKAGNSAEAARLTKKLAHRRRASLTAA